MNTPIEFNPYMTMVEILLLEAEEIHADQVLMISGLETTNLYFLSDNRVCKMIPLDSDVTPDFITHLSNYYRHGTVVRVNHAENGMGRCISLMIEKPQQNDVNSTMPMPRVC